MSIVTGVVLQTSCNENTNLIYEINKWLRFGYMCGAGADTRYPSPWCLMEASHIAGGGKHPQVNVLVGGFSGFGKTAERFKCFVLDLPWFLPEQVVLLMTCEEAATQVFRPTA